MPLTPRIAVPAVRTAAAAAAGMVLLTGCTKSVDGARASRTPAPTVVASKAPPARTASPVARTGTPTPSFGEAAAVPCAGYPSPEQVIAFLRRTSGLLPANATVIVQIGPLCAGTWQYTVLAAPNQDPLQVVTRGTPSALRLVTAGTDVCSEVAVRATAPAGIRTVARC